MDRRAESSDRSRGASMTRDVAIRGLERQPSQPNSAAERRSNDVWTSAISRLQAQVSYNTGMLESHRRQLTEIESVIGRLHHEVTNTVAMLNDVRVEMRARPAISEPPRHDTGDLEVLAGQLQRLTNRVNEIDGMSMQIDLMKNRMKRMEEGGAMPVQAQLPGSTPARKDGPQYETGPRPSHPPHHHQQQQLPPHQPHSQHPPLPPMRTASMVSTDPNRPPNFPTPPTLESQGPHGFRPSTESRTYPIETAPAASQPPPGPNHRPGEALPPPSALSGWRPAEAYQPHGPPAAGSHHPPPAIRPSAAEAEVHGGPGSGWAAVNANAAVKRPPEETRSPYESPLADGSKRPKLAPLMPNMSRGGYAEEGYGQPPYQSTGGTSNPSESSFQQRSRAPSDGSQPPSQPVGPTPAQQSLQHNFRFVTSSQQSEPPEPWRGEAERAPPPSGRGGRGRGRGRGGRGRGRGGGGRGDPHHMHHAHHPHHHGHPHHGPPEHPGGTPEWERPGWEGNQASPNGHHPPTILPSYSPVTASRGVPIHPADVPAGSPVEHPHHDYPATPIQGPLPTTHDPYAQGPDGSQTSSGKKTRTKPIRNAEGILIRKDGRPDMRSVSSANNLRKVHAKKEAERMEDEDGNTRSATPASVAAGDMDTSEEPVDAQERHHELMSRIFPPGGVEGPGAGRVAEQFFPRHHQQHHEEEAAPMKTESGRETREGSSSNQEGGGGGGGDVVMGEATEEERRGGDGDVKMSQQQTDSGSQERSVGVEDTKAAEQPSADNAA